MIVADASLAAKWLFAEEEYAQATNTLIFSEIERGDPLYAPSHFQSEISNVIRKRMRRDALSRDHALTLLDRFLLLPVVVVSSPGIDRDALVVASEFDLPTVYDAYYLAVAQSVGCEFWTDDRRLLRNLAGRLPFVRWIGEYGG